MHIKNNSVIPLVIVAHMAAVYSVASASANYRQMDSKMYHNRPLEDRIFRSVRRLIVKLHRQPHPKVCAYR